LLAHAGGDDQGDTSDTYSLAERTTLESSIAPNIPTLATSPDVMTLENQHSPMAAEHVH